MATAVVVQPKLSRPRLVRDVRMLTGDALVGISRSFGECDVVGADEAVATVSHFRASPEVDPVGQERIAAPLGNAASDAELDASRCCFDRWRPDDRFGDPAKHDIEFARLPVLLASRHVIDRDDDIGRRTAAGLQPFHDSRRQRRLAGEHGFEPAACFARPRQHGYPNAVERKHPRPAAARLDLALDDVENRVHDLQRLALAGAGELLRGPIEPCRDL